MDLVKQESHHRLSLFLLASHLTKDIYCPAFPLMRNYIDLLSKKASIIETALSKLSK